MSKFSSALPKYPISAGTEGSIYESLATDFSAEMAHKILFPGCKPEIEAGAFVQSVSQSASMQPSGTSNMLPLSVTD